jgi:hypothetical protein
MGWDQDRFVDKDRIAEHLICSICIEVVEDPLQTPCEHSFCKQCINRWLSEGQRICPVDRQPLTAETLKPPNRLMKDILNNLTVRCKYYGDGCYLMTKFQYRPKLIEHETNQCQVVQNMVVRELQEKHKREVDELRTKISKLEESLSLEKGLRSIAEDDNATLIGEKQKIVTGLENKFKEEERKNSELLKGVKENAARIMDLASRNVSVPQTTNQFAGPTIGLDRCMSTNTSSGKFHYVYFSKWTLA